MGYRDACDELNDLVVVSIAVSLVLVFFRTRLETGPLDPISAPIGICIGMFVAWVAPLESPISVTRTETYPWIESVRVTGQPNEFLGIGGILTLSTFILYDAYQVFGGETPLVVGACILFVVVFQVLIYPFFPELPQPISSHDRLEGLDDDPPYYQ